MPRRPLLLALPLAALIAGACTPDPFRPPPHRPGRALTGDAMTLSGHVIRLAHVDAPETGQRCTDADGDAYDCGEAARMQLARLTDFREVSCRPTGRRVRRMIVGECETAGRDLSLAMAASGWALAAPDAPRAVAQAGEAAQTARRGLWAGGFAPPGDFRAGWRLESAGPAPRASPAAASSAHSAGRPSTGGQGGCAIKGNVSRTARIYHQPGQAHYPQVVISPEKGDRWFCSETAAIAAGWRRATR